jgi:hypothetical protein
MSALPDQADELDQLVDQTVAAPLLGLKPKTLANLRHKGGGPDYYKINGGVRYSLRVIAQYREARRRSSTSDPGRGGGP